MLNPTLTTPLFHRIRLSWRQRHKVGRLHLSCSTINPKGLMRGHRPWTKRHILRSTTDHLHPNTQRNIPLSKAIEILTATAGTRTVNRSAQSEVWVDDPFPIPTRWTSPNYHSPPTSPTPLPGACPANNPCLPGNILPVNHTRRDKGLLPASIRLAAANTTARPVFTA